jgi:1-deoxy-D-xylulose-5-phosphate synthase
VVFVLDRGGLVGADGPTHHGAFDLTYLRMIPGMVIMAPKDESELRDMLYTAVTYQDGPVAVRYPRGEGLGVPLKESFDTLPIGKGETLRRGEHVALLAIGDMVQQSLSAAERLQTEGIEAEVVNMRFVKPLDAELLDSVFKRFRHVVTIENNSRIGGLGGAVSEYRAERNLPDVRLLVHGLPDRFVDHGSPAQLLKEVRLDADGIAGIVLEFLRKE